MPRSSQSKHGRSEIILIGPSKAGKSTLAVLLAQRLNLPHRSLDEKRWRFMREIGYDEELDRVFRATGGFLAKTLYWQLFNAYVVERFLAEGKTPEETAEEILAVVGSRRSHDGA